MAKGLAGSRRILLLLIGILSCTPEKKGLTRNDFARMYAEIASAQASTTDSAAAVDSAMAISRRYGVDSTVLHEFRDRLIDDPEGWIEVWEQIVREIEERPEERPPALH